MQGNRYIWYIRQPLAVRGSSVSSPRIIHQKCLKRNLYSTKNKPHLYQKLLSRKKILPKDPWLPEEVSTKKISEETFSTKKNIWRDILHQVFCSDGAFYTRFFAETSLSKKLKRTPCPTKKTKDIDISTDSTKKSQETLQKNISKHMFYQKLPSST